MPTSESLKVAYNKWVPSCDAQSASWLWRISSVD